MKICKKKPIRDQRKRRGSDLQNQREKTGWKGKAMSRMQLRERGRERGGVCKIIRATETRENPTTAPGSTKGAKAESNQQTKEHTGKRENLSLSKR